MAWGWNKCSPQELLKMEEPILVLEDVGAVTLGLRYSPMAILRIQNPYSMTLYTVLTCFDPPRKKQMKTVPQTNRITDLGTDFLNRTRRAIADLKQLMSTRGSLYKLNNGLLQNGQKDGLTSP